MPANKLAPPSCIRRAMNRNNLGMKRMYRAMLSDGKEPPIVKDVGELVRIVFLASDFSVPFRSFVQDKMKSGFLLSLEHLLVLQYILRHDEIDLATAAEICQQDVREARESLRRLVVSGILDCVRRDQATYWALNVQTEQLLKGSSVGQNVPLTKIQAAQLRVLSVLEERTGGIKASEVRQITGLSVADAKYLLRQMSGKSLIRSVGRGPGSIWYLVGDLVGEFPPLDSPTIAVGEEKEPESPTRSPTQFEKFIESARELGCEDNEEAVDELMKRVASSPPPRKDEKAKTKRQKRS